MGPNLQEHKIGPNLEKNTRLVKTLKPVKRTNTTNPTYLMHIYKNAAMKQKV